MIYLGNGLYSDADYLEHHGIKGQHWGVRRGPPYPIQRFNKQKIYDTKDYAPTTNRPHSDYNLNKWGSNKDSNCLWVTGISGSGKSTIAKQIADKNNADLINIDTYTFKTTNGYVKGMSKRFNKFLDKTYPNWRKMQKDAYEAGIDKIHRHNKYLCGKWFDTLEDAIKKYSAASYGKKKIVAEGVQILDETLFYNNKKALKNQPLIIMDTPIEDSILSGMKRDNRSTEKQMSTERVNQLNSWLKDVDYLKSVMK